MRFRMVNLARWMDYPRHPEEYPVLNLENALALENFLVKA
jgi:hypothetical protein